MLPIPAIDLKEGQCVRLKQGRMEDATHFSSEPLDIAEQWIAQGAKRLHLVDLDGAFAGSPKNRNTIYNIARTFPHIELQIGGGIRDQQTAQYYFDIGINYCIIGSKAVSAPESVAKLAAQYPQKIILGIDAKNGQVATDGWAKLSEIHATALAQQFNPEHIAAIIYTDIAKDGMMQGVNLQETIALAKATPIPIIASGGIAQLSDLHALKNAHPPIFAAILGRALYEKAFTLQEAYQSMGIKAPQIKTQYGINNPIYEKAIALRKKIFIEEQHVPENEELVYEEEIKSQHFILEENQQTIATARYQTKNNAVKIERFAVHKNARKQNYGKILLKHIEAHARKNGAKKAILSAQEHAIPFYEKLGYKITSAPYLDANITHRDMEKAL